MQSVIFIHKIICIVFLLPRTRHSFGVSNLYVWFYPIILSIILVWMLVITRSQHNKDFPLFSIRQNNSSDLHDCYQGRTEHSNLMLTNNSFRKTISRMIINKFYYKNAVIFVHNWSLIMMFVNIRYVCTYCTGIFWKNSVLKVFQFQWIVDYALS